MGGRLAKDLGPFLRSRDRKPTPRAHTDPLGDRADLEKHHDWADDVRKCDDGRPLRDGRDVGDGVTSQ